MSALLLIDGQPGSSIPADDRGLQYGDGLFETLLLRDGQIRHLHLHVNRLSRGCQLLGIHLGTSQVAQQLTQLIDLLTPAQRDLGIVKIIVTRGGGGRGYSPPAIATPRIIIQYHDFPASLSDTIEHGIDCIVCRHTLSQNPRLAGLKHLNRLDQVLAAQEVASAAVERPNIGDGLMTDGQGHIVESTRCNVFFVIDGQLLTPDLSNCGVAGTMRQWVLSQAQSAGWPVVVRQVKQQDLPRASEVFLTNAVLGIVAVNRLYLGDGVKRDGLELPLTEHHFTRQLQNNLA